MPGKDSPAELVLLALPHNAHTGTFEAEVESSDPGEKGADIHAVPSLTLATLRGRLPHVTFTVYGRHSAVAW